MQDQDSDFNLNIMLVGDQEVGKTPLLLQFSEKIFTDDDPSPTPGIGLKIRQVSIDGKIIKLQIYDTSGNERFTPIVDPYYKKADGIILIYDITSRQSFININNYLAKAQKNANKNVVLQLVGNKSDFENQRLVAFEEGVDLADSLGIKYLETSAQSGFNVDLAFTVLAQEIKDKLYHAP